MTRILFVDDDPAILDGLRRMLHQARTGWSCTFVPSAEAAMELLEGTPDESGAGCARCVDVVVTDMRMGGPDGAQLLAAVRRRWPQVVRIVLSGYSSEADSLRSAAVAHQFISKPCAPDTLLSALSVACGLSERLSRPELRRLLGGLGALPVAPKSYAAITSALAEPTATAATVARVIENDAGCTAKLLQLVNSAFFGLARRVTTVRDAVAYLGLTPVRSLVLASEVAASFDCAPDIALAVEAVNEHSLAVAAVAREMVPPARAMEAFVAGMLHDIGWLALASAAPDLFRRVRLEMTEQGVDALEAERRLLDATHADIGAYLLHLWGLPLELTDAVARHHDDAAAADAEPVVAAVARAEAVVSLDPPVLTATTPTATTGA